MQPGEYQPPKQIYRKQWNLSSISLWTKKSTGSERFTPEFHQMFKELTPMFLKILYKVEGERMLPSLFYKASIIE
jgi:hypothetical protein